MKRSFDDCFAYDRALIPVSEAIERLRAHLQTAVHIEDIPLAQAGGRYLAAPLAAPRDVPAFDNVAVDGWAVRWTDAMAQRPLRLPVTPGRAAAGHPFEAIVPEGHALRVLTGAVLPDGVDTVVLQEECTFEGEHIVLPAGVRKGANCRPRGEDIGAGEVLFDSGECLRPQDIGAAALMGFGTVPVFERLRVAIFSTGDEVTEPGQPLPQGGVFDANRPMLASMLKRLPVDFTDLGRLADERDGVEAALTAAARSHHAVITTGGASQGDEDHVAATLREHGSLHFWRIALKPGRPMAFGQIGRCMFIGLPGNPVASFVCFALFARPMLAILGGGHWPKTQRFPVRLAEDIKKNPGRTEMVRARLEHKSGYVLAHVIKKQGSGVLTSLVEADGLLELEHDLTNPRAGTMLPFMPFNLE